MSDDCTIGSAADPTRSPGIGFVWCPACELWYPPTSVHAAIADEERNPR